MAKKTEIIILRDIDYKTAKKEILEYYEKFKEAYQDEVANNLRVDLRMTVQIINELIKEKRLEVIG